MRLDSIRIVGVAALLILAVGQASAAEAAWAATALDGGHTSAMVCTGAPGDMFVAAPAGGVFKSTDGGATWARFSSPGLWNPAVIALALDEARDQLYAATEGAGIFVSGLAEPTWEYFGPDQLPAAGSLVVDTVSGDLWAAGQPGGVYVWREATDAWTPRGLQDKWIHALILSSAEGTVYAAADDEALYVGPVAGSGTSDWSVEVELSGASGPQTVTALAFDPADGCLFAGTWEGQAYCRSCVPGETWAPLGSPLGVGVESIVFTSTGRFLGAQHPAGSNEGGVYQWQGDDWGELNTGLTHLDITSLEVDAGETVWATTRGGGLHVLQGGVWATRNGGLEGLEIWALAGDPSDPSVIYAGTLGGLVHRSTDRGASWVPWSEGLQGFEIWSLAAGPDVVLAGTNCGGVFVREQDDPGWTPAVGIEGAQVWDLAISSDPGQPMFAGTANGTLFRSDDRGSTWLPEGSAIGSHFFSIAFDEREPGRAFAGTLDGVLTRDPASGLWTSTAGQPTDTDIRELLVDANGRLWAGSFCCESVWWSDDAGASWQGGMSDPAANQGLANGTVTGFGQNPISGAVYTGLIWAYGGVFNTNDQGASWSDLSEGLPHPWTYALLVLPGSPSRVFAAAGGGLFVRDECALDLVVNFPPSGNDPESFVDRYDVQVNGGVTSSPGCPAATGMVWDWGDGTIVESWFPASHTYRTFGEYTVGVTAIDAEGGSVTRVGLIDVPELPGSTEPGTDVVVQPEDPATGEAPVTITFAEVTEPGLTEVQSFAAPDEPAPDPPGNFMVADTFVSVTTTAAHQGPIRLCFEYDDTTVRGEPSLRLYHIVPYGHLLTGGGETCDEVAGCWENITDPSDPPDNPNPDTDNNVICGTTDSLSLFAILEELEIDSTGDPVVVNSTVTASAAVSAPHDGDVAVWNWGDGSIDTVPLDPAVDQVTGTHAYTGSGIYAVRLALHRQSQLLGSASFEFVVVYDPNGAFVTGGGWITSPAGAYPAQPVVTGKATFGFVSRYRPGADAPDGRTRFQFNLAGFDLHSTSYEWLAVSGPLARFQGDGEIDGTGQCRFMLTALDGDPAGGGEDRFRIKIWDPATGAVFYDSQVGDPDDAAPQTALGGGSIVIHQ